MLTVGRGITMVLGLCRRASTQQGDQKQEEEKRGGMLPRGGLTADTADGFEGLLEGDALGGILEALEVAAFEFIDGDDAIRIAAGLGEIAVGEREGGAIDFADQLPTAFFGASVDQVFDGLFALWVVAFPRDAGAAFGGELFDPNGGCAVAVGLGLQAISGGGFAFGGGSVGVAVVLWCGGALLCEVVGSDLHFLDDAATFGGLCEDEAESESAQPPDSFHGKSLRCRLSRFVFVWASNFKGWRRKMPRV